MEIPNLTPKHKNNFVTNSRSYYKFQRIITKFGANSMIKGWKDTLFIMCMTVCTLRLQKKYP